MFRPLNLVIFGLTATLLGAAVRAQNAGAFRLVRDHPAILYSTHPTRDAVTTVNDRLDKGELQLTFDTPGTEGRTSPAMPAGARDSEFGNPFAVEVSEVVHDPELDEAVIAFANADFTQCEEALRRITAIGGVRNQHAETWLVLFDLYRATGQQALFESLAQASRSA